MKKGLVAAVAVLFSAIAFSQQTIELADISKHVGDTVKICTKIYGGIYLDRSKGTPTLLNAGGEYPNNPLTIVIWENARKEFKNKPEEFYKDKDVCITGKVELYKDKPQIIVHEESQLVVE